MKSFHIRQICLKFDLDEWMRLACVYLVQYHSRHHSSSRKRIRRIFHIIKCNVNVLNSFLLRKDVVQRSAKINVFEKNGFMRPYRIIERWYFIWLDFESSWGFAISNFSSFFGKLSLLWHEYSTIQRIVALRTIIFWRKCFQSYKWSTRNTLSLHSVCSWRISSFSVTLSCDVFDHR